MSNDLITWLSDNEWGERTGYTYGQLEDYVISLLEKLESMKQQGERDMKAINDQLALAYEQSDLEGTFEHEYI